MIAGNIRVNYSNHDYLLSKEFGFLIRYWIDQKLNKELIDNGYIYCERRSVIDYADMLLMGVEMG